MFKKLKSKKAFTLVELIVTIALFSIFSLGTVSVVVPVLAIYNNAIKLSDANLIVANVLNTVETELQFAVPGQDIEIDGGAVLRFKGKYGATEIMASPDTASPSPTPGRGYLMMKRGGSDAVYKPYYDEKYYKNNTVEIHFVNDDDRIDPADNIIKVTVDIFDNNDVRITTVERYMKPFAAAYISP